MWGNDLQGKIKETGLLEEEIEGKHGERMRLWMCVREGVSVRGRCWV